MLRHTLTIAILSLSISTSAMAEQYLTLKTGSKYLGHLSKADEKKFILCDAKVAPIPEGATLEDTLEKCGQVWVMNLPSYRLLTISEGAAMEHNDALAKEALATAVKIQDPKEKMADTDVQMSVGKIEAKAGVKLQVYLVKGQTTLSTAKDRAVERP